LFVVIIIFIPIVLASALQQERGVRGGDEDNDEDDEDCFMRDPA
jgi:hypothetical protein